MIAEEEIAVERVGVLSRRSRRNLRLQPNPVSKPESPQKKNCGRPIKGGQIECPYPDCLDTLVKNQSLRTHLWWRHRGRLFDGVALAWQQMQSLQHHVRQYSIDQVIRRYYNQKVRWKRIAICIIFLSKTSMCFITGRQQAWSEVGGRGGVQNCEAGP